MVVQSVTGVKKGNKEVGRVMDNCGCKRLGSLYAKTGTYNQ